MFPRQEVPGKVYNEASHGNPDCQEEAPEVIVDRGWVFKPEDHDIPAEKRKLKLAFHISLKLDNLNWQNFI